MWGQTFSLSPVTVSKAMFDFICCNFMVVSRIFTCFLCVLCALCGEKKYYIE